MRGRLIAAVFAAVLLVLAGLAWLVLQPGWAVNLAVQQAQSLLGRTLTVKGGAHLSFSPLAIRLDEVELAGAGLEDGSLLTASSVVIPVTFGDVLARKADLSALTLEGAEFALLIDERGTPSWEFPGAKGGSGISLTLDKASFRFFDARNSQSLSLAQVDGVLNLSPDGGIDMEGRAVIANRVARIDATLKSLPRVHGDGSPLDLVVELPEASATFSGRLSTASVLSLTGPFSLVSEKPVDALRIMGLPVPAEGLETGPLNIDGGMDSAGRAFAIRKASVTLGGFRAAGDVVLDLRNIVPKLQASLKTPALRLDAMVPASGATSDEWGRALIDFGLLRTFDAEIGIDADSLNYGTFSTGAARITMTVAQGKLDASGAARLADGGTIAFRTTADANVLPVAVALTLKAENTEAGAVITALTGQTILSGNGTVSAALTAEGKTQEELAGTLKGSASLALTGGRIAGVDAGGVLSAASQNIVEGWSVGETAFDALTGTATLSDGIATVKETTLETPSLGIALSGSADLLRRAIDLSATAKLKLAGTGGTAALPVPVVIKGPWAAPRIYPDIPDILLDPKAGFARLKQMGLPAGN